MDEKEAKYHRDKFVVEQSGKGYDAALESYRILGVDPDNVKRMMREKAEEFGHKIDDSVRTQEQIEAQLRNEIIMKLHLKERGEATELLVNHIKKDNHIYTTKSDEKPEIWIYESGIYVPNGECLIEEICRRILDKGFTTHLCSDVKSKIRADTYIEPEKFFISNYKDEIPVLNGILNVRTRQLSPFTPRKVFFNKCPIRYDKDATCHVIDSFLSDVLANKEDRMVFYEIGGFCLYKEYNFEKAFMFVGDGRNGKGKSLELIKRVVGAENCYSLPLAALQHHNADVSQLFGKMVNLAGDIGFSDLKDTSMFKSLTGRDWITAKRKFLTAITFENYAKFIFACNELPRVYDMSKGFWDRWILLEFPYYFATFDEWTNATQEEKKMWKIRDEDIINKIAIPGELSGLLNAFLDGLDRVFKNGKFSSTKGTEQIKEVWIRKADAFQAFCMDFIQENYECYISVKELRSKFAKYCKEHKLKGCSDKAMLITLESMFGITESRKYNSDGQQERIWNGICWKEVEQDS